MSIGQTSADMSWDTLQITMVNVDTNPIVLMMLKPDGTFFQSDEIIPGTDADSLKSAISGFYSSLYSVNPIVTLIIYDASGVETTAGSGLEDAYKYLVETPTPLSEASIDSIMVMLGDSGATVDI